MHAMVLCVLMCILSSLSAMAVWSRCKFLLAQTSRRAPRRALRSNRDMEGGRLDRARGATSPLALCDCEASQPRRGVRVGGDTESPERRPPATRSRPKEARPRRYASGGAIDVGQATGNEKPGRIAKRLDAPLELTDRSEPRGRLLPRSSSFDKAIARGCNEADPDVTGPPLGPRSAKARDAKACEAIAHGRSAKARDAKACESIAHGRSAKARDAKACAPATAPGQSTVSSETVPAQAGPHRRSLPRSGPGSFDQAIAHDRAAGATLSAASGGMPVPGSTSPSSRLAPAGPPPRRGGSLTTRPNSSIRMLDNDQDCPPTPLPKPAHARRTVSNSGTSYHHVVRKRLAECPITL